MRRIMACSVLAVLCCVSLGSADLVTPRTMNMQEKILPYSTRLYLVEFKGNETGRVIVSGDYRTCMGLYVFDADGNCVAHDDRTWPTASDDLNVDWIPAATGRYAVGLCNGGPETNVYNVAMR